MPLDLESRRRALTQALRTVALEGQVESLAARLRELDSRLRSVESMPTEPVVTQLPPPPVAMPVDDPYDEDTRVAVPKLDFDEVRMSSTAAQALFGG